MLSLREGEEPSRWAFEGSTHRGGSAGCRGADLLEGELCTAALLIYPQAVFFHSWVQRSLLNIHFPTRSGGGQRPLSMAIHRVCLGVKYCCSPSTEKHAV